MKTSIAIIGCCCLALHSQSADVTQFRGEGHLGAYPDTGLLKVWPENGPKRIWTVTGIGAGYSSVISVGDVLYVTGVDRNEDNRRVEKMTALDKKGERKWQTVYGDAWSGQYPNVRTTPTFRDGALYAISGAGEVVKIEAASGKILWKVEAKKNYSGENGNWGTAESPAVDDRAVYCTVGGDETAVVALSVKDGSLIWKSPSLNDPAAYVSPTMITHHGVRQLLCATSNFIFGVNPENGTIAWRVNIKEELDDAEIYSQEDCETYKVVRYKSIATLDETRKDKYRQKIYMTVAEPAERWKGLLKANQTAYTTWRGQEAQALLFRIRLHHADRRPWGTGSRSLLRLCEAALTQARRRIP